MKSIVHVAIAGMLSLAGLHTAKADLINGSFEGFGQPALSESDHNDASINPAVGWFTTESDHQIEVWGSGFNGVPSYDGTDFAELNANAPSTLYQVATGIAAGSTIGFEFAHRGRVGVDTMELTITDLGGDGLLGTGDDTVLFDQQYSDGTTGWGFYQNPTPLIALGNDIEFAYQAVSAAGGLTVGNFIDDAHFGVGVGLTAAPEPSAIILMGTVLAGAWFCLRRRRNLHSQV